MGKSKSRIFRKGINDRFMKMSRTDAVTEASKLLNLHNTTEAKNLITMFGLSAEELLEAGSSYESVVSIKNLWGNL